MIHLRTRVLFLLLTMTMSAASLYFEWVLGLAPCPLCIMQRVSTFALVVVFFVWCFVKGKRIGKTCLILTYLFAFAGLYFAGRQLYIELSTTGRTLSCGPSLNALIQYFPLQDLLHALFYGSGECGHVSWRFMWFSMASWSTLLFSFIVLSLSGSLLLKCKQAKVGDIQG